MRVNRSLCRSACFLAGLSAAYAFAPAKVTNGAARPAAGVKTPGIQIPMTSLKTEAEVVLEAPATSIFVNGDTAIVTTATQVLPLDLKTNKLSGAIDGLKSSCTNLTNAFRSTWVSNCAEGKIDRWDSRAKKVTASVAVPIAPYRQSMAATSDSLWVLSDTKTTLSRIDPDENKIVAEIRLPAGCNSLLFAETALWLACPKESKVYRVDPATNVVVNRIEVPAQPVALVFGEGSVWVLCKTDGKVVRIDPKTNKTGASVELKTPGLDGELAFGEGFVWVSSPGFPIMRVDPATDKVAQQFYGEGGGELYFGGGSIWALNLKAKTLSRFDPKLVKAILAD